ncbi:MAG: DNA double-strand break repair nuclease NurA [Prochloraceae cyanobacterium]|nr:DNA double-strand break repair nuclease NurA [Prochloraceae cyanobacterium]
MSYQLNLPLEELARDRGKLNTLRNMIAVVSAGIEKNAEIAASTIEFTVNEFADILRENTPFDILSADSQNSKQISPYPFQIFDLVQSEQRPKVFSTVKELANRLDLNAIKESFVNTELIGIDESQVDIPLPQSNLSFLKSVAFRTYEMPNGSQYEQIGPVVSDMRIQLEENDSFENANKLLGYIRNNFIAYISALTALPYGRKPFVILHGPLIRAIGGFTHIIFDYKDAHRLLNINLEDAGEFKPPPGNKQSVMKGDSFTKHNLSLVPEKALDGEKNILEFNKFCINICDRKCGRYNEEDGIFPKNARPKKSWTKDEIQRREYPGFCLYFWVLRSLFDLARISEITIASVVEDVSAATEMTRLVLPSLLAKSNVREQVRNSALNTALKAIKLTLPKQQSRSDVYNKTKDIVKTLRLSDSNIFSFVLDEGQYTAPVEIYRYRTRNDFIRAIDDRSWGTDNALEPIFEKLFPTPQQLNSDSHPGYRVLMSYVRTTPLREPVRVEYFDLPHLKNDRHDRVIGPIYVLSLPYQEYGMPIILYYADKMARTPTKIIRTVVEKEYLELILQQRLNINEPLTFMRLLGRLTRNYFQREGM